MPQQRPPPQEPFLYFLTAAAASTPAGAFSLLPQQRPPPQEPLLYFLTAAAVTASQEPVPPLPALFPHHSKRPLPPEPHPSSQHHRNDSFQATSNTPLSISSACLGGYRCPMLAAVLR
ncbi:hypothetical protein ROHU_005403 [Labeo rohita]|uniref:Uncharacterized protein n=1 Tax=Labeo rohita TaxID=84645 RepID=A0A498L9A6_LABRO|nr:hypothetical protein ROHU_013760 [Labeo rohita]RXN27890.1 hypothetical protein ROHU_005403 [Labeo rohita]